MAIALAVLLGLVTLALAAPVGLMVRLERTDRLRSHWRVRWLFGLVNVQSGQGRAHRPATTRTRAARKAGRTTGAGRRGLSVLRTPGLVHRVGRLLADLWRTVHCEEFSLEARFGFDDPADTGFVYGLLAPVLAVTAARGAVVRCYPDFTQPRFDGTCAATLTVRPLSVVGAIVMFCCSPPVLRAVHAWSVGHRA